MDLPYTYLYIPDFPIPHSPEANAWWQLSDDRVSFSAPPIAWPLLSFPSSPVGSSVWGIACRLAYVPRTGICPIGCGHSPTVPCTADTVRHGLHVSGNIGVSSARPPIFLPLCDCFSLLIVWRCFELLMMSWGYIFNIRYKYKTYFSNNRHLSMFFSQYHRIVSDCSGLLKSSTRTMMTPRHDLHLYFYQLRCCFSAV